MSRDAVLAAARRLFELGLNRGSSGNVSVRVGGGMLITASGIHWEALSLADIVHVRAGGSCVEQGRAPSSEWQLHEAIYDARPDVNAVVHTHSMFCTTLSTLRMDLPAVHYMLAVAGTNVVRCADYATFGTAELARNAVAALGTAGACLLANHGALFAGGSLSEALRSAEEVELVAEQYWRALQIGRPFVLDDAEMARVRERFKTYGHQVTKARRNG